MVKAIVNVDIYDYEKYRKNQYVLIENGEIKEVGDMKDFEKSENFEIIDFKNKLMLPGFVNGHTHIYSTFARGMIVPFNPKSFKDILIQLWWKLDSKLDKEAVYHSGLVSAVEFIKNGVTTVIDHHASGLDIRGTLNELKKAVVDEMKLRGIFCFETSDRFDVDLAIEENLEFMKESTEKCAGIFGMHASLSLSDDTLRKISELIKGKPIHIHVAESYEDEEDSLKKYGKRVVQRLWDFGLLNENSIFAHCVHINSEEAKLLAENKIYVALNPTSNMNNAVGLPNYRLLKEFGVKAIMGNDGLGFNLTRDYQNLYYTQHYRYADPLAFSLNDLIDVIKNTYEIAGKFLNIKIGRIEKGYKADLITYKYIPPTEINENNIFGHLFFGLFDRNDVVDVIVDGEFLMKDKELNFDEERIYNEARKISKKVWRRLL